MCIKYKDDIFHDVLQCLKILFFQKPQIPHMKDNRISFRYFTCTSPCLFAKNIVFPLLLCGPIIRFNTALPLNYPLIAQLCQLHTHENTLTLIFTTSPCKMLCSIWKQWNVGTLSETRITGGQHAAFILPSTVFP